MVRPSARAVSLRSCERDGWPLLLDHRHRAVDVVAGQIEAIYLDSSATPTSGWMRSCSSWYFVFRLRRVGRPYAKAGHHLEMIRDRGRSATMRSLTSR